jgi:hypothetical protein
MLKKTTQGTGAGGYRHTAPTLLSVGGQKGIHIFERNIVETTILLAQPAQELARPFCPSLRIVTQ